MNRRVLAFALHKACSIPPHPGLVRVLGAEVNGGAARCWTELCGAAEQGGGWAVETLDDQVGTLGEGGVWNALYEVVGGLDHLHKFGIAHCDISARNMVVQGGRVKASGFGLGRMADVADLDLGEEVLRLAPEQLARPEGIYEGAAFGWDVYGFGVLAYRLITGRYPRGGRFFESETGTGTAAGTGAAADGGGAKAELPGAAELAAALCTEPEVNWPEPAANVGTARCREIAERCLRLDPAARPVDLREVREAFDNVRHHLEMESLRAEVAKAQSQAGTGALAAGAAGVAAGAVAGAGVAAKARTGDDEAPAADGEAGEGIAGEAGDGVMEVMGAATGRPCRRRRRRR